MDESVVEAAELNEEQREMLRSLERSMAQAARGEGRPVRELLGELRTRQVDRESESD